MRYCLNIGLNTNDGSSITPFEALAAASDLVAGASFVSASLHNSDTEETLVLVMVIPSQWVSEVVYNMAIDLRQDAIALVRLDDDMTWVDGRLVGPFAEKWGPFNPEFFILPNGTRAS